MINTSIPLEKINEMSSNTMLEHIGIEITELHDDYLVGTMPVDSRTVQPMRLLHGGATAALIESLGSVGSSLIVDMQQNAIVGIEVNANHVRGVKEGKVTGVAKIVHCGRKTHLWQVDVTDEKGKLVCTGRLTVLITPIPQQ